MKPKRSSCVHAEAELILNYTDFWIIPFLTFFGFVCSSVQQTNTHYLLPIFADVYCIRTLPQERGDGKEKGSFHFDTFASITRREEQRAEGDIG